ncbi:MAG: formylglycine-generating enzyme family protein [Candidatus Xenobiia bacterium LiM19]
MIKRIIQYTSAAAVMLLAFIFIAAPSQPDAQQKKDLPARRINPVDGAEMVLIPAGEFTMGSPDEKGSDDEHPQLKIYLDAFYIYKYEVTNGQFEKFAGKTGYKSRWGWDRYFRPGMQRHPVISVTWEDAQAYCIWARAKLPTEAQWEKAARGTDGRKYPWGNSWSEKRCNWWKEPLSADMTGSYTTRWTVPVGSFPLGASPYGLCDMSGNAMEWCRDWYSEKYYSGRLLKNPQGPPTGQEHALRGGSWYNDVTACMRCANRFKSMPMRSDKDIGFRCIVVP